MYYIYSILLGILIATMIVSNGGLTSHYGIYEATAMIHFIGLIFVSIFLKINHEKVFNKQSKMEGDYHNKKLPFYLYLGGALGMITTVFNNMAFGKISVSAILALGLLGQSIASLFIDQFGLFGMPKCSFPKKKLIGIFFVILGIILMVSLNEVGMFIAIIVSFMSGIAIVLSRTINAKLAQETSLLISTFYNYVIGLFISCIIMLLLGGYGELYLKIQKPSNVWIYLGGVISVFVVILSNATVTKISSLYMTLLIFIGQVFTGILLDFLLTHTFSQKNLIGSIFVTTGLALNVWLDKNRTKS